MTYNAAIIGPTGYAGFFLLDRLLRHPEVNVTYLASRREEETDITVEFPKLLGRIDPGLAICRPIDADAIADEADVVFLALPHRAAMATAPSMLDAGLKVVDLSADYRLADANLYEDVYDHKHTDRAHLKHAVYGLPELFRDEVTADGGVSFVANPGCYPTAAALAIAPLLSRGLVEPTGITINAASGVTGAGRSAKASLHFPEENESFYAYGQIGGHRHQPEIVQTLGRVLPSDADDEEIDLLFVPHLLPIDQGILETIYLTPAQDGLTEQDLMDAYIEAYQDEPFVRVVVSPPNVKHVRDTNFCDVTVKMADDRIVAFSAIDNMIKGASGQAIQNMNLMLGLPETMGLL